MRAGGLKDTSGRLGPECSCREEVEELVFACSSGDKRRGSPSLEVGSLRNKRRMGEANGVRGDAKRDLAIPVGSRTREGVYCRAVRRVVTGVIIESRVGVCSSMFSLLVSKGFRVVFWGISSSFLRVGRLL